MTDRAKQLLKQLEWSSFRRGPGFGYMGSGGDGRLHASCPICGGLRDRNGDFVPEAVGHRPNCELARELGDG